jgi:hypothetical protein
MSSRHEAYDWITGVLGYDYSQALDSAAIFHIAEFHADDPTASPKFKDAATKYLAHVARLELTPLEIRLLAEAHNALPPHSLDPDLPIDQSLGII